MDIPVRGAGGRRTDGSAFAVEAALSPGSVDDAALPAQRPARKSLATATARPAHPAVALCGHRLGRGAVRAARAARHARAAGASVDPLPGPGRLDVHGLSR